MLTATVIVYLTSVLFIFNIYDNLGWVGVRWAWCVCGGGIYYSLFTDKKLRSRVTEPTLNNSFQEFFRDSVESFPVAHMWFPVVQFVLRALLMGKGVVWWFVKRSLVTCCFALSLQENYLRPQGSLVIVYSSKSRRKARFPHWAWQPSSELRTFSQVKYLEAWKLSQD